MAKLCPSVSPNSHNSFAIDQFPPVANLSKTVSLSESIRDMTHFSSNSVSSNDELKFALTKSVTVIVLF